MSRVRRVLFVLIAGIGGLAALVTLGVWQSQRLIWKQGLISELEQRMAEDPVFVSGAEAAATHNFRRAIADGAYVADAQPALFLTSLQPFGPGHRVISVFELRRGGRILVDRGFIRDGEKPPAPPSGLVGLAGTLHWPNERGAFTPDANVAERRWFARDVEEMAGALETAPVMLVLGESDVRAPLAVPVSIDVPDNHLAYAITWFSLAGVWLVMTVVFMRRSAATGPAREQAAPQPASSRPSEKTGASPP